MDEAKGDEHLMFYPGHKLNCHLWKLREPEISGKPFVAEVQRRGHPHRASAFTTQEEAEAFIEDTVRRSERGFGDTDKSSWD